MYLLRQCLESLGEHNSQPLAHPPRELLPRREWADINARGLGDRAMLPYVAICFCG